MTPAPAISTETLRWMHQQMVLIREAEEAIAKHYHEQEMRCPTHLCVGQEAVPVGLCAALQSDDYAFGGPTLIEARTYRWREHCGPNRDDQLSYRDKDEVKAWMERDPIRQYERRLLKDGVMTTDEIESDHDVITREVAQAIAFAKDSPFPDRRELMQGVYAP